MHKRPNSFPYLPDKDNHDRSEALIQKKNQQ